MSEKSSFKLIVYALLIIVLFLGLIGIVISLGGKAFYLDLIGLLFLLLLTFVGFVGYTNSWGERVLFFVFLFYVLNLILVWYFNGSLYLILLLLAVIGILISFPKKSPSGHSQHSSEIVSESSEPHSEVFDVPQEDIQVVEPEQEKVKKAVTKKTTAKHSPGKLVASKNSNIYHLPKCEWAKKIKRHRRIWFKSKEEAWEQGYRAHSCVK